MPGLKFLRADSGSVKVSTEKPLLYRPRLRVSVMSGSSSTTAILFISQLSIGAVF